VPATVAVRELLRAAQKCPASAPGIFSGDELDVGLIVVIVSHVFHRAPISFAETFPEFSAGVSLDRWVFVHLVIIGIPAAVFTHVMPGGFDAFMKSATLRFAVFRGRLGPAVLIVVVVLGEDRIWDRLRFESMRLARTSLLTDLCTARRA